MSTLIHDAVIVQISGYVFDREYMPGPQPDLNAFRAKMPAWLRPCAIGPFLNPMSDTYTAFWMPDGSHSASWTTTGSKKVHHHSEEADKWRHAFLDLFSFAYDDGSSPYEVIRIQCGPGMRGYGGRPQLTEPFTCYCPEDEMSDAVMHHQNGCPQHG